MSLAENEKFTRSSIRPCERECMNVSFHCENKIFPNTFVNSNISSREVMDLVENKSKEPQQNFGGGNVVSYEV